MVSLGFNFYVKTYLVPEIWHVLYIKDLNRSSQQLLVQSEQMKHESGVSNIFKANNKDIKMTSMTSFLCLYWQVWINFTHCYIVSIVDFEQLTAGWGSLEIEQMISFSPIPFFYNNNVQFCTHCVKCVQLRGYFWFTFFCIRTEYGDLLVRIQENVDQK